jgi:hypothetical protein
LVRFQNSARRKGREGKGREGKERKGVDPPEFESKFCANSCCVFLTASIFRGSSGWLVNNKSQQQPNTINNQAI